MDQLLLVLHQLLLPDNAARKAAEASFKSMSSDPGILPALLQFVRHGDSPGVRQLAAVLMRRRVATLWPQQSTETKEAMKAGLLESVATEPNLSVRRASAEVAAVIAKHTVPAGEWPQLLPFLLECSRSQQESHRQLSFVLFASLVGSIGEVLRPLFPSLKAVFTAGLQDNASADVRHSALKAVAALVEFLESEEEVHLLQELVEPVLSVAHAAALSPDAADSDSVTVVTACEIVTELLEHPSPAASKSLPAIVRFALDMAANTQLAPQTRFQAAQVLAWSAAWKSKALVRHRLVPPILSTACQLLGEPCGETDSEDDEEYETSAMRFAAQVLDAMAMEVPRKHVVSPVVDFARSHVNHTDHNLRYAAVMSLAVITEGCADSARLRLSRDWLPLILAALADPHPKVRSAACFAVGQLSEYVQPEASTHHAALLPAIFRALSDAQPGVQEKAYYALAAFCEHLGDDIVEFLAPLMTHLLAALTSCSTTAAAAAATGAGAQLGSASSSERSIQEMSIAAIGSAAGAAGSQFAPFCPATLSSLVPLVSLSAPSEMEVRARAYELVGIIGLAVGRQAVEGLLPGFMEAAIKGFALDHSELREYAHGFFADVAKLLEKDFAPYMPHVAPLAFASCRREDGVTLTSAASRKDHDDHEGGGRSELAAALASKGIVEGDSDEEDEDEEGPGSMAALRRELLQGVSVRTGLLDEKAAAVQAIGAYAQFTGAAFHPFLEESVPVLQQAAGYGHEDVRLQALSSLSHVLDNAMSHVAPQIDLATQQLVAQAAAVKQIYDSLLSLCCEAAVGDVDKEVAAQAFTSLSQALRCAATHWPAHHAAMMAPYAERIVSAVRSSLRDELECQKEEEDEEGEGEGGGDDNEATLGLGESALAEDEEEEEERSEEVVEGALDVLPLVASAAGDAAFAPVFAALMPDLMEFTKASRPADHRSLAVGCIAELAMAAPQAVAPHLESLLPRLLSELRCSEPPNRRNAAFCVGKLCEAGGGQAHRHYTDLLLALHPLFAPSEEGDVRDNAAGAVARMVMAGADVIPLSQVLPVLLQALPIQSDDQEAPPVFHCLSALVCADRQEALQLLPQILPHFAQVLAAAELPADTLSSIRGACQHLMQNHSSAMQQLLAALAPDVSNLIMNAQVLI